MNIKIIRIGSRTIDGKDKYYNTNKKVYGVIISNNHLFSSEIFYKKKLSWSVVCYLVRFAGTKIEKIIIDTNSVIEITGYSLLRGYECIIGDLLVEYELIEK